MHVWVGGSDLCMCGLVGLICACVCVCVCVCVQLFVHYVCMYVCMYRYKAAGGKHATPVWRSTTNMCSRLGNR